MLNALWDAMSYFQMELGIVAGIGTLMVALLAGFLSPAVVMKEKSYVGDVVAHYVFPGVVAGYFVALRFDFPVLPALFVGAAVSALAGTFISEFVGKTLRTPTDASAVVTLTGFFGLGVVGISKAKGARLDLHSFLFGNILGLEWTDICVLGFVFVVTAFLLWILRDDWEAWICDPEFASLAGFRTKLLEKLFPVLVTLVVLVSLFAVGALMVSALLTLPAVLVRPRRVVSGKAILLSVIIGAVGLVLGLAADWPIGSAIVTLGLVLVIVKATVVRALGRNFLRS